MSLYKIVQEWDDSGGLEAFQNAKFRYWAKINNRQCDIPLPDPDLYIDEVDYNAVIDPEVVVDLFDEAQQPAPNNHSPKTSRPQGDSNNEAGRPCGRNKDGVGCFGSRKRSSRFKTNFYPTNSSWRNFRGNQNRIDHSEQTVYAGRPTSQQWKPTKYIEYGNNQASNDCGALIN